MKKCPKCGTVLDDGKKKCYMCGAELTKSTGSFAENFDLKIGAQTSKGQDSVFGSGKKIDTKGKDLFGKPQKGVFFSNNSSASGILNGSASSTQLGGKRKNNDEIDPTIMDVFEKDRREKEEKNISKPITPAPVDIVTEPVIEKRVPEKKVKQPKVKVNKEYVQSESTSSSDKINFNIIFNILSIIVFLGLVIFGYFKFVKPKKDENSVTLGNLSYIMDSKMNLTQDDKYNKYYTRGDSCAIKISYGQTNDVDGFVDSYFDQIREEYSNDDKHLTKTDNYKLNGSNWEGLTVFELVENPASAGGFSTLTKYKYISVVRNGKYYTVVYANTEDDSECSKIYESFVNTLKFSKK